MLIITLLLTSGCGAAVAYQDKCREEVAFEWCNTQQAVLTDIIARGRGGQTACNPRAERTTVYSY
jgi:hypothetical protein